MRVRVDPSLMIDQILSKLTDQQLSAAIFEIVEKDKSGQYPEGVVLQYSDSLITEAGIDPNYVNGIVEDYVHKTAALKWASEFQGN